MALGEIMISRGIPPLVASWQQLLINLQRTFSNMILKWILMDVTHKSLYVAIKTALASW